MNKKARSMIAVTAEEKNMDTCEINLEGCMKTFGVAPAHRKKRVHYRTAEQLADINEWVVACTYCHEKIEVSRELTEQTFRRLRPV